MSLMKEQRRRWEYERYAAWFVCLLFSQLRNGDKTKEEYMKLIDDYIEFYNNRRYQMRLNKMAPVEYRSQMYGT